MCAQKYAWKISLIWGESATSGGGLTSAWCDHSGHSEARQGPPKGWVGPMKAGKGDASVKERENGPRAR